MLSVKSKSDTFGRSVACLSVVSSPGFKNRRIFHAPKWDQAACAILSCSWKIDADSIATNFRFHLILIHQLRPSTFGQKMSLIVESAKAVPRMASHRGFMLAPLSPHRWLMLAPKIS